MRGTIYLVDDDVDFSSAVQRLLEKVGVDVELLHEGRHKDAYQGLRPLSDEERTKLQAVARDSYDSFVELVARERKKSVDDVRALATGEFWSGKRALALGLVDALGDREQALFELAQMTGVPPGRTVRVVPPRPFFERMMGSGFSGVTNSVRDGVSDAIESLALELRR